MKKVILALLLLTMPMFAQELTMQIRVHDVEKLQALYFSDLDLLQQQLAQDIFDVIVVKNSASAYSNCTMFLEITRDGGLVTNTKTERVFFIPADPVGTVYQTNNAELLNNNFYFQPGNDNTRVVFEPAGVSDDIQDLRQDVLATGKLPIGEYRLRISITSDDGQELADDEVIFIQAINPSFVTLVGPGNEYGSDEPVEIVSQFPMFQWNGNGVEYEVFVYEKKQMMNSVDDVLLSTPNWQSGRIPVLSAQYPQAGAEAYPVIPLEYGRIYFWRVKMYVQTSAGEETITSEVWQFKLVDPANAMDGQGLIAKNDLLELLRQLMGSKADEAAKELEGFGIKTILVNGQPMSLQELRLKINSSDYLQGNLELLDYDLR